MSLSVSRPGAVRLGTACPGIDSRGHGLTMAVIHGSECCQRFEEQKAAAQGAEAAARIVAAQTEAGANADQIEAVAEEVLAGRHDQPATTSRAFYAEYDITAAILTAELREMEAG